MLGRCLVTGGAGFIGSHLAESLVADGIPVRVFDSLETGKLENLAGFADRVEFVQGDVRDAAAVREAARGCDAIFHLAAMVSVPRSVREPRLCHDICATGTMNVLEAARDEKVRRVIYAGSSSAYGDPEVTPLNEAARLQCLSPYAAAKLAGEHYATAFASVTDVEAVRLRFFNVFGPRQDPSSPYSGVIAIFCSKLLDGQRPMIHGDGQQTRDFVFVTDVVAALRSAAITPGVSGRVFNVGTGRAVTVADLARSIARVLDRAELEPQFGPARAGDILHSVADITAIQAGLGFRAKVDLASGLARCLDFYRPGR
jgi:UDP-glucose 4-epimerase